MADGDGGIDCEYGGLRQSLDTEDPGSRVGNGTGSSQD